PPRSPLFPYTTLFRSTTAAESASPVNQVVGQHLSSSFLRIAINCPLHNERTFRTKGEALPPKARLLIVDDEASTLATLSRAFRLDRKSTRLNSSHLVI